MSLFIEDAKLAEVAIGNYDICIFSSGYEKRARFLLSKLYKSLLPQIPLKICLQFHDFRQVHDREINDALFRKNDFQFIDADKLEYGGLSAFLHNELKKRGDMHAPLSVLIDYTVMRRNWYSEILQFFNIIQNENIKLTFVYTCGSYIGNKKLKMVNDYLLVPGFEGVGCKSNDKYGIYGLGYEPISVQSLHDWVEPHGVTCIIANPGSKLSSRDTCFKLNKNFIEHNACEIIETPINFVRSYCSQVLDIIKTKSNEFDIVLFGGGPKPFVLGNFLCSILRPKCSNIYLKGPESDPINVESTGELVITDVTFLK